MRLNYVDNIDCMEGMKSIPDNSVDLIIADPPYGIDFQSNMRRKGERLKKIANDKRPYVWWLPEACRVLKNDGALITFFRWDVQDAFLKAMELAGLGCNGVCVWDKAGTGMGDLKRQFAPAHELFSFSPKPDFRFPNKRPPSVIRAAKVPGSRIVHPNQKPEDLIIQLIEITTLPPPTNNAVVLDPFMGSGTTAVACLRTGRNFIGFEIDEKYHAIAQERIAEEVDRLLEEDEAVPV